MPTARELLEEADALMRRNRALQSDDIPLLTDAVPVLTEAQVLRGRGAASLGSAAVPGAQRTAQQPDSGAFDSIPTLTETVDDEVDPAAAPDDGGEPSDWLAHDAGDASITGEVPDSVLVVPRPEVAEPADETHFDEDDAPPADETHFDEDDAPPADETHFDEDDAPLADEETHFDEHDAPPAELRTDVAAASAFDDGTQAEEIELVAPPHDAEEAFEAELGGPASMAARAPGSDVPPFVSSPSPPPVDRLADVPDFAADGDDDDVPTIIDAPMEDDGGEATAAPVESFTLPLMPPAAPMPAPAASAPMLAPAASAPMSAPAGPAPVPEAPVAPAPNETDWEGVAEEIRMQVLQRIDIFTDTGLRDQLSLRLQPIVDRASADLVATINQHVGELLRAYVAEAIEREIESWRRNH